MKMIGVIRHHLIHGVSNGERDVVDLRRSGLNRAYYDGNDNCEDYGELKSI